MYIINEYFIWFPTLGRPLLDTGNSEQCKWTKERKNPNETKQQNRQNKPKLQSKQTNQQNIAFCSPYTSYICKTTIEKLEFSAGAGKNTHERKGFVIQYCLKNEKEKRRGKENRNNRLHPRNPLIKNQTVINQWVGTWPLSIRIGEDPHSCPSHDRIYSQAIFSSRVYLYCSLTCRRMSVSIARKIQVSVTKQKNSHTLGKAY